MDLVSLEAIHVRLPLKRAVKHASATRVETDNLLVRVQLGDGSVGWGEGVPRDYVTGETIDSALDLVKSADYAGQLPKCDSFPEAVAAVGRFRLPAVPGDGRGIGGNAARCAVELALLDAYGRRFGENLSAVTRLVTPGQFAPRPRARYSGVILSARGLKLRLAAVGMRVYGFGAIKVKVGVPGRDDRHRLRTARRCVGPAVDLRVDANEAWTPDAACAKLEALKPARISSVEQPVAHEHAASLAGLRKATGVPVVLDESLCSVADAELAVADGWCDAFNVRLSKCGGYIPSLRLAEFARERGLWVQLGCQVGESGILSAAGRHFATSVGGVRHLEGSYDRRLLKDWLTEEDVTFGRGGYAPALSGLGHSATPDPTRVAVHAVRREVAVG